MECSYNILNNKFDEINNCYNELLEKFEIVSSQLAEKTKRTNELIIQKDQLKSSLDYYVKYTDFSDKEKSKFQNWKKNIDEQISHYESIIKEKDNEIEKLNQDIHNLNSKFFSFKNEKEETIKQLNSQLQKLENKVYDACNNIPQLILENIHQNKLTFSYETSKNKIQINYNESTIAEVNNEKGTNYISPSNKKSGGSNSITLNNYISSSSSSGISNPHNITFLSNINNKIIVVSNERDKTPELPISHFNSSNDIKVNDDYLINTINNFTITSFGDEIPLHYKESLLSDKDSIQRDKKQYFYKTKKCIECAII